MKRETSSTGTPWEKSVGYSRAVKVGNQIWVSGTTASTVDGDVIAPGDAYGQARCILEKIGAALGELGATHEHVVRTRMFVTNIDHWEDIGRAHGEVYAGINPAATMVEVNKLIDPEHLVEIEVDAVID